MEQYNNDNRSNCSLIVPIFRSSHCSSLPIVLCTIIESKPLEWKGRKHLRINYTSLYFDVRNIYVSNLFDKYHYYNN